ncbi:MAG: DNA alkylation repair protein [Elusimicrobiaceae bacterium]|nr:DNA alkylation repair protein [Elusimicrobiaceae bacterium]
MTTALIKSRTQELVRRMEQFASPAFKKQLQQRQGISPQNALGTPITTLRKILKALPRPDQALADALWDTQIYEARLMASMLADPMTMTRDQLHTWVREIDTWGLCDACALNLFAHVKKPFTLIERWIKQEKELTRRAGFATLTVLAMPRTKTADKDLIKMLPLIKTHACDPRPLVYKAVNGALRMIGKKNPHLTPHAMRCAQEILDLYADNRSAVWVAKNALWKLNTPQVKKMISRRK